MEVVIKVYLIPILEQEDIIKRCKPYRSSKLLTFTIGERKLSTTCLIHEYTTYVVHF